MFVVTINGILKNLAFTNVEAINVYHSDIPSRMNLLHRIQSDNSLELSYLWDPLQYLSQILTLPRQLPANDRA